jgi:hypothetical protein
MDPRIQIRIHPKISWIRNTAGKHVLIGDNLSSHISVDVIDT